MRVLQVSTSDREGGAARAAYRLHRALLAGGIESHMRVNVKASDDETVVGPRTRARKAMVKMKSVLAGYLNRLQWSPNPICHSSDWWPSRLDQEINAASHDVVHLHWVQGEFFPIEAIGRLQKPVVWTLHDSWLFCGSEHHPQGLEDRRYIDGYQRTNRPPGHGGIDLDRWCWKRKSRSWRRPMCLVSPSRWLASAARASALVGHWPIHVIPNPLPTAIYRPWPQSLAREAFGLPKEAEIMLFGAIAGRTDPNKGWDLLAPAIAEVGRRRPGLIPVVFGMTEPIEPPALGVRVRYVGRLYDDQALALLYNAADVMAVPSRLENLPQAATEAQSCGTPVVAFNCGGNPDAVVHRETGYLAAPYDSTDFARGLEWVLEDRVRLARLREQARRRAEQTWSTSTIVARYTELYGGLAERAALVHDTRPA